jgi:hypothetical protein
MLVHLAELKETMPSTTEKRRREQRIAICLLVATVNLTITWRGIA